MDQYDKYLPPGLRGKARDYFAYSVNALALAAGTVATPTFSVQADSDFLVTRITGTARNPAAPTVVFLTPALTLLIESGGSGRNLFNQASDWRNIVGTAEESDRKDWPKILQRASTVRVTLTNIDLAPGQAYDVRLTFEGFKIFGFERD